MMEQTGAAPSPSPAPRPENAPTCPDVRFRPAWRSQLRRITAVLAGLAIFLFADTWLALLPLDRWGLLLQQQGLPMDASTPSVVLSSLASLAGLTWAAFAAAQALYGIYSRRYFIGARGIEATVGIVSKDQSRIEFKHIRGMNLRQTIAERLLGIGTIDVTTAGSDESEVRFAGIAHPKRYLDVLRERLKALA